MLSIIEAIYDKKARREQGEFEAIKRNEEEKARAIIQKEQDKERERVNQLISYANDYNQAQKVYEFIAALESHLPNIEGEIKSEQMKSYILWAKLKGDWLNPLIRREDEILGRKYTDIITNSSTTDNKS
jgi:hypothetical protein